MSEHVNKASYRMIPQGVKNLAIAYSRHLDKVNLYCRNELY